MCELTPKISWSTTIPPFGVPEGSDTYAEDLKPSAALSVRGEEGMGNTPMSRFLYTRRDRLPASPSAHRGARSELRREESPKLHCRAPVRKTEETSMPPLAGAAVRRSLALRMACRAGPIDNRSVNAAWSPGPPAPP